MAILLRRLQRSPRCRVDEYASVDPDELTPLARSSKLSRIHSHLPEIGCENQVFYAGNCLHPVSIADPGRRRGGELGGRG
jgi:hypothetical protein